MESNVSWGDWVIIRYLRAPIMGWFITWYSAVFFKDVIKMGLNASIYFMNSEPITRKGEKHVRPHQRGSRKTVDVNQNIFSSCFSEDDSKASLCNTETRWNRYEIVAADWPCVHTLPAWNDMKLNQGIRISRFSGFQMTVYLQQVLQQPTRHLLQHHLPGHFVSLTFVIMPPLRHQKSSMHLLHGPFLIHSATICMNRGKVDVCSHFNPNIKCNLFALPSQTIYLIS